MRLSTALAPAPIRAVTFDVGGTLIKPWPSVGHLYAAVAARHGVRISARTLNGQFAAAWKTKKNFRHRKSDWSDLVDQTFAGLVEIPPSASFFPELYKQFACASSWRIFADVIPCLEKLRRCGIRLGAISNWDERLRPLLRQLNLDRWFETILVSIEAGHPKPDPRIFALAAKQLKTAPAAILHIGDSPVEDLEGARAAGFQSLLLQRGRSARQANAMPSLTGLLALILPRSHPRGGAHLETSQAET
jgi:putative hydrolase of the HAD superfamily